MKCSFYVLGLHLPSFSSIKKNERGREKIWISSHDSKISIYEKSQGFIISFTPHVFNNPLNPF